MNVHVFVGTYSKLAYIINVKRAVVIEQHRSSGIIGSSSGSDSIGGHFSIYNGLLWLFLFFVYT
jgi:hypothetical protein